MRYYNAKLKAVSEERIYRVYTADSLYYIRNKLGITGGKKFSEIIYPQRITNEPEIANPVDTVRKRIERLGLKVVDG